MPKCPHCDYESNILSAFCPACGGAMQTQEPVSEQQEAPVPYTEPAPDYGAPNARPVFRQNALGMGWLRFLAMFVLPMNIINGILYLFDLPEVFRFMHSPEITSLLTNPEKVLFYTSIVLSVVQVPLLGVSLWGLFTQRWLGVQTLLINYAINALYAVAMTVVLLTLPGASGLNPASTVFTTVLSMVVTAVAMIALFFANRVYFLKRRGFFLPEKQ